MKILFVMPNKDAFGYKPIGLALLSAIAKKLSWETKLFDTTEIDFGFSEGKNYYQEAKMFKPVDFSKYGMEKKKIDLKEKFKEAFENYNPDLLAFSVLSDQFLIAAQISKIAKEINPKIPILWGGVHATLVPEEILKNYDVDFVFIGEGFEAFKEFLIAFADNKDLEHIANVWTKKDGLIIKNPIRPLKANLDDLPYLDWDIFDNRHFYKPFSGKIYIGGDHMLNWGCPNNCTYCVNHFYHDLYRDKRCVLVRRYSTKRIIEELKHLKEKHKLEFFKFFDEDFLMRPLDSLKELSEAYRKEVNIPFSIETNPKLVDKEKVQLLKNMNCVNVSLGVETGDLVVRKELLNRIDSEEDIIRAFSLFKEAGIKTSSFNMLGLPYETREKYKKTVELNRKANPQYPQICFFYPFVGTKLREIATREGFFDPEKKETAVFRHDKPALHFKDLSEEELVEMRNVFVLYVKLPNFYEQFIERSEKRDEIGKKLREKLLEIYDNTVWKNDGWYIDDGFKDNYLEELNKIMENRFKNWQMPEIENGKPTKYNWVVQEKEGLNLGKYTDIGAFCYINASEGVEIEEDVQIGGGAKIYSVNTIDETKGKVVLKKNCKIGANSVILPNVEIGENSIVGALSLVKSGTKIPDNEIWVGRPAKKIGEIINGKRVYNNV